MELFDAMRTTFSGRAYTGDPLPDATLYRILEHARFAPGGGTGQGWGVIASRARARGPPWAGLPERAAKRYTAQVQNGENPWNTVDPPRVDAATIERTPPPPHLTEPLLKAAAVL